MLIVFLKEEKIPSPFDIVFMLVKSIPLSKFARTLLSVPVSNADCERIFSMVSIKTNEKRVSNLSNQ